MKTLNYQDSEKEITRELINQMLDDSADISKYAAGFGEESNKALRLVRDLEYDAKMELADEGTISTAPDKTPKQIAVRRNIIVTRIIEKLNGQ